MSGELAHSRLRAARMPISAIFYGTLRTKVHLKHNNITFVDFATLQLINSHWMAHQYRSEVYVMS